MSLLKERWSKIVFDNFLILFDDFDPGLHEEKETGWVKEPIWPLGRRPQKSKSSIKIQKNKKIPCTITKIIKIQNSR